MILDRVGSRRISPASSKPEFAPECESIAESDAELIAYVWRFPTIPRGASLGLFRGNNHSVLRIDHGICYNKGDYKRYLTSPFEFPISMARCKGTKDGKSI